MILQQLSIARLIRVLLLSLLLLFGLLISYSNGLPVESKQKQRRRLRRHKQEIFKLPEKVGTRRKGSHKSSRQRNNRHPSYVAEFEEYYGTSGTHFDRTDHPTALPTSEDTYFPTNENDLSRKASKSKKKGKSHYSGGKASTKGKKSSAYKSCPKRKKKRAGKSLFWGLYNETSNDTDLYEYDCPQRKSKKRGKSYGKSLSSYDIETESPYPTATGMPSPAPSPLDNLTSQPTVPGTTAAPTSPIIETATPTVILPGTVAPTAAQLGTATPTISQAGTTAPTTTAQETLAPTMSAGTTETPTVSTANTTDTTAPTVVGSFMDMVTTLPGPSTVDLLPFALLYDIDRSDIPGQDDYQAAAEVISTYLQDYFSMRYNEAAESQYLSGTFTSGDTAYSLGRGALTDFEGSATFSNTGITPTPAELDMALEEAFTGENVQVVLDLLGMLPPENLFSTAVGVMKVEPSTGPVGGRSSKSKVAKSLLTVAAIGMISLLAYGAGRIWMGFRKERNIKGAFLCGDDIIIGDRDGLLVTRNAI